MAQSSPEQRRGRREFVADLLRAGALAGLAGGAGWWLSRRGQQPEEPPAPGFERSHAAAPDPKFPQLAVVRGQEAGAAVRRAIEELGGMRRFVGRGDIVVIKPNMAWDRTPEQAANTSPAAVLEVARLAWDAGARRVIVADAGINEPRRVAERSGIAAAARAAGAELLLPEESRFRIVDLGGEVLRAWPVFRPLLEADKVINLPAAKHHDLTGVTLGLKNWFGILGGERQRLHQRIHESLADLAQFVRPTLTVLDAWRVLVRNGPSGGNLEDVELSKTVVAGTDAVALDAYAARLFWGLEPRSLRYLELASQRGLGRLDLENVRRSEVTV
ncbi:MAG: DUF362 domain-containing protein [Bryobacteraceae bacterium]|jgi:uncharacterized protein (DUF362 family)